MPYITPDEAPVGTVNRSLLIPNNVYILAAVNGAITGLLDVEQWEELPGHLTREQATLLLEPMIAAYFGDTTAPTEPTAEGIKWLFYPLSGNLTDRVNGGAGTLHPGSTVTGDLVHSASVNNGGIYFPLTDDIKAITNQYTVLLFAKFTTGGFFPKPFAIPMTEPLFEYPYMRMGFQISADQIEAYFWDGSDLASGGNSGASTFATDNTMKLIAYVRDGDAFAFYEGGALLASGTGVGTLPIAWEGQTTPGVVLFNNHDQDLSNQGFEGDILCSALFGSVLSQSVIAGIASDPTTLLNAALFPRP